MVLNWRKSGFLGSRARKPVFGVSDKFIPKPACLDTETTSKVKILIEASLDMILTNK